MQKFLGLQKKFKYQWLPCSMEVAKMEDFATSMRRHTLQTVSMCMCMKKAKGMGQIVSHAKYQSLDVGVLLPYWKVCDARIKKEVKYDQELLSVIVPKYAEHNGETAREAHQAKLS